jgi:hypothetical protein
MARSIKLIVTGDMEKAALHKSLQRFFPAQQDGSEVTWEKPRKVQGATSYQLKPLTLGGIVSNPMKELAKAMLAEVLSGKNGNSADLVIVIDDVELGNLGQEHIIAEHFRTAVIEVIQDKTQGSTSEEARLRDVIRKKCSFHLLKPMVEAYLFGDSNALGLAGVPSGINPCLVHLTDVEEFETNDPQWLPTCCLENTKQQINNPWWCHERHPKHYLEYLTESYDETIEGKTALLQLNWTLVSKCQNNIPIFRSLFEDISNWYNISSPIGIGSTHPNFWINKMVNPATFLLRNM